MALIDLQNVKKYYGEGDHLVKALDGVSLTIDRGEFVAIMGQSGSGKSTLMNILGCLDTPSAGVYTIQDQNVASFDKDGLSSLRRDMFGFIFQRYNLLANASALENVEVPAIYAGVKRAERHTRAEALLQKLGLGARIKNRPGQLSGGQQQRVAIARALMNDPSVILADEPTGALDSRTSEEVLQLLKDLHTEGRTVIIITHDEQVAKHADRQIRIQDGKIVSDTGPRNQSGATLSAKKIDLEYRNLLAEIAESGKIALRALHANIFRTSLTLLGIIIGVAAVVTMMAIGQGSMKKVLDQITAMGTNLVSVRPGLQGFRGDGDIVTLIPSDAEAILSIPNVEKVLPERNGRETVRFGNLDYATSINGMGADLPAVRDWPVAKGTFFTEADVKSYAPVVVLGQTLVDKLFPYGDDPVGQYVLIKNTPFEVIGILSKKGASWGQDQDDVAIIPYSTGMIRIFGQTHINAITVKIKDLDKLPQTEEAIKKLLLQRHRIEDFNIRNMASFIDMISETQGTLTVLLGAVAAISLLVGGIGVMNIMLVSITERTREIGVRMATGARMRDIFVQFSTEAAVVCLVGGTIGIVLGFTVGLLLRNFEIVTIFTPGPSILAFSSAFLTGLIFGYWPARKAARLDPVVALASE